MAPRTQLGVPPIAPVAILATVAQAMMKLGIKRTKVNDGRLERVKVDGGKRTEVASIQAVARQRLLEQAGFSAIVG